MIYEYAVDPNCLCDWHRLRQIADGVGVPRGRLLADYPNAWKKTVMQLLSGKLPVERARLESQYQRIKPHLIPSHRPFDPDRDWLLNAETVHEGLPFRAIVAADNPRTKPQVLKIDDLNETIELWRTSPTIVVAREAASMADQIRFLLQLSREVVMVDPNFDPAATRFRRPFEQFMNCCVQTRNQTPPKVRLIVEAKFDASAADDFDEDCTQHLAPLIPGSMSCEVIRVRETLSPAEKLHNRYILTDRGGIQFSIGLDDSGTAAGQTEDMILLSQHSFDTRWRQYAQLNGFDRAFSLVVVGTKVMPTA